MRKKTKKEIQTTLEQADEVEPCDLPDMIYKQWLEENIPREEMKT